MVVRTRARLGRGGTLLKPKPTAGRTAANGDCAHSPTTARRPEPVPIPAMCPSKIHRCPWCQSMTDTVRRSGAPRRLG